MSPSNAPSKPAPSPSPETPATELDVILKSARADAQLDERIDWIRRLVAWIRLSVSGHDAVASAHLRLKRLFTLLDHQPALKDSVARTLRSLIRDTCALDLFCETGLPRETGFLSEAFQRVSQRFLPPPPYDGDVGTLFNCLFPDKQDAVWIESLDADLGTRIRELFLWNEAESEAGWNTIPADMEDAIVHLSGQVASVGGSTPIRSRLERKNFRELPFARLLESVPRVIEARRRNDGAALGVELTHLRVQLDACHKALDLTTDHLEKYGVSPGLVYQIERMRAQLLRVERLVELFTAPADAGGRFNGFLGELIRDNQERRSLRALFGDTSAQLARRIVERNAETGEHYIARTRADYFAMLRHAAGGGAITAGTMLLKVLIVGAGMSPFFAGTFAGLNYAASFVLIQVCGFTLATKQPANTAPALARQMNEVRDPTHMERLVDEIACLVRSQAAAIFGNLALVVPMAILLDQLIQLVVGHPLMDPGKVVHTVGSFSILGPSFLFAALTGVLLWFSSLVAAATDNWHAYRRINDVLIHHPQLNARLGPARVRSLARYLDDNLGGLVGNVVLGFMLGMLPTVWEFIGLPLDIRHVTLSAGSLGAALSAAGTALLREPDFWLSVVGVLAIGLTNVAVSFSLALVVAIRARRLHAPERHLIYRAVICRLVSRPLSFLLPDRDQPSAQSKSEQLMK